MYLSQTTLEIDTTKVYLLDGQEIYLTKPVKNSAIQLCTVKGYEMQGRDVAIYELNYQRKRKLIEK